MISEAETILATTTLPEGRAERAHELVSAAVKLADGLLELTTPAAAWSPGWQEDRRARAGVLPQNRIYAKDVRRRGVLAKKARLTLSV